MSISAKLKRFLPDKKSLSILKKAFKISISPLNNQMSMSYEECLATYLIARILRPRYVVETGVAAGRSSSFILCALEDNGEGELFSIDPDPHAGYAIPHELRYRWHFINDKSENVLEDLLKELKTIDIFLHDSLHTYEHMMYEYSTTWPYIKVGGVLLSDDIGANNAFYDFYQRIKDHGKIATIDNTFGGILKLKQ